MEFAFLALSTTTITFLGTVVFLSDRKNFSSRYFAIYTYFVALWSVVSYWSLHPSVLSQTAIVRIVMLLVVLQLLFLYLSVAWFPAPSAAKRPNSKIVLLGLCVAFVSQTDFLFKNAFSGETYTEVRTGPAIALFLIYVIVTLVAVFARLKRLAVSNNKKIAAQARLMILGFSIILFLAFFSNFVAVVFFSETQGVVLGSLLPFLLVVVFSFAMLRHELYRVSKPALRLTAYYLTLFSTLAIAAMYFVMLQVYIATEDIGYVQIAGIFYLLLVFLLAVSKLVEIFDRLTDYIFRMATKKMRTLHHRVNNELSETVKALGDEVAKLKAIEQARLDQIGFISHQIKSPLTSILMITEPALRNHRLTNVRELNIAKETLQAALKIQILVDEFLDSAISEEGFHGLKMSEFDGVDLAKLIALDFAGPIRSAGLKYDENLPNSKAIIAGDKLRLGEAIANLFSNAIKYNNRGGKITLNVSKSDKWLNVEIIDTGIGIEQKYHKKVFGKYARVDYSEAAEKGFGLGLFFFKEIVNAHGGEIIFDSAPGKGTKIGFRLPLK